MIEKLQVLEEIVKEVTEVDDITRKKRTLDYVDARFLFSLACLIDTDIKKDFGPVAVSEYLNVNHATINHYLEQEETFLFQRKYLNYQREQIKNIYNTKETAEKILLIKLKNLESQRNEVLKELCELSTESEN